MKSREEVIEALGGIEHVADVLDVEETLIQTWMASVFCPHLLGLELAVKYRLYFPDRAVWVGAVAEGFDLVWPAFGARLEHATIGRSYNILRIDGARNKVIPISLNADVQAALFLAQHLAIHDPTKVLDLLKSAPSLVSHIDKQRGMIAYEYLTQKREAEKKIQECEEAITAYKILQKAISAVGVKL